MSCTRQRAITYHVNAAGEFWAAVEGTDIDFLDGVHAYFTSVKICIAEVTRRIHGWGLKVSQFDVLIATDFPQEIR